MFKILCLLALTAVCYGASIGSVDTTTEKKEIIPLLKFETDKKPDGSFRFMYEGGDKTFREESGVVENAGTDDEALEVSGSYRYIDADGREIEVHYTAGKNGFVPYGTNILSEISALAKAAADLPNESPEEEVHNQRKARSRSVDGEENIKVEVIEDRKPLKAAEKKPIKEAEKKPVVKKPEEKKPEEKKPEEKKPEEKKPEEKKPEEKKPGEKKPEAKKPEEKKPEEKKPAEKKPEEKKPEEKKPEEKKPEEKKPEEKKPAEKKPEEKKPEENKPEEKKH